MLLEALIGILIFSIGILALIAMQATAVTQVRDAQYRTEASVLADRMMGNMVLLTSSEPAVSPAATITAWQTDVTNTLPNGSGTVVTAASALGARIWNITITVNWRAPGASTDSNHVVAGTLSYNQP